MKKTYPIEQSCFYRLRSKRKLLEILGITGSQLKAAMTNEDAYRVFTQHENGKARTIEEPRGDLRRIHDRLQALLSRIEPPPYLHSGVKRRSYLSNAKQHVGQGKILKADIKKFFPSTTHDQVFRGFLVEFKCEGDVARLLTDICTFQGHVPTGSPISMAVAFLANKQIFDGLYVRMQRRGIRLTIYVDDLTLSAPSLMRLHFCPIKKAFVAAGYQVHKTRFFVKGAAVVTGVVVKENETTLPNRRHLRIIQGIKSLQELTSSLEKQRVVASLTGQIAEAANVDKRCHARWLEYKKLVERLALSRSTSTHDSQRRDAIGDYSSLK